ncbi:DNA cytosine methyltransferase [Spiroplasma sp. DGKH1]|uniref:DNA cytosine methyltransferase n=1 Tax=Spiroplasma sp. DGKH1 TaxID=3050074 RepID=UPI0034C6C9D8
MNLINKKIKVLEIFGGIGAPRKALENLGYDIKSTDYIEVLDYATIAYNRLFKNKYSPQDVRKWNTQIDLLVHGSPCQDWSNAGKKNIESGRSLLFLETIRIIEKELMHKPKYIVWENVKGLLQKCKHKYGYCISCDDFKGVLNHKDYSCYEKDLNCSNYINDILESNGTKKACHWYFFNYYLWKLENLGYTNTYKVLNSKDFGIPQNRERVFVVSILNSINKKFIWENVKENEMIPLSYFLEKGHLWKVESKFKEYSNFYTIPRATDNKLVNGAYNRIWKINSYVGTINVTVPIKIGFIDSQNILHWRELSEQESWKLMGFTEGDFKKVRKSLKDFLDQNVDKSYYIKQPSMAKAIQEGKIKIVDSIAQCVTTKQVRWNNAGVVKIPITTFNKDNYIVNSENGEIPTIMASSKIKIAIPINKNTFNNQGKTQIPIMNHTQVSTFTDTSNKKAILPTITTAHGWPGQLAIPIKTYKVNDDYNYTLADGSPRKAGKIREKEGNIIIPLSTVHQNNIVAMPDGNINTLTLSTKQKVLVDANEYLGDDIPIFEIEGKYYYLRVLTEQECWRLMGFNELDIEEVKELPKTALYQLAGNSIVVPVLEAIFKELLKTI